MNEEHQSELAAKQYTANPWVPTTNLMELRRLGKLLEELGEATASASRCIIQGVNGIDPETNEVNIVKLWKELADVQAQIKCCQSQLVGYNHVGFRNRVDYKVEKMIEWETAVNNQRFVDGESNVR